MRIRPSNLGDLDAIDAALLAAANWEPAREPLPLDHPSLAAYREGWGRPGDIAVIAEVDGLAVGAAYCRLMRGYGYVDDRTPEVTIGVQDGHRNRGVGGELLRALAQLASEHGFDRLSLSVEPRNPARRLYEREGYRVVATDAGGSIVMVVALTQSDKN